MLLRQAVRRLVAAPLFTVFAVVSLAAGVAITTAAYSVVDALLFAHPGIDDPDRVISIASLSNGRSREATIPEPDLEHLRAATTSFAGVAASVVAYLPRMRRVVGRVLEEARQAASAPRISRLRAS